MITKIAELETLLSYFETTGAADRNAALGLVTRWAKRMKFRDYSADELYRAVAIASSQRRPEDLALLRDIMEVCREDFPTVAKAAREELDERTALFSGKRRRQLMPESLVR